MNSSDILDCPTKTFLALNDCLTVMNGKWKAPIIGALLFGPRRFKDLENAIKKITPRMLSKELKELELSNIVRRKVHNSRPVRIEYELTQSGFKLKPVFEAMVEWGTQHRVDVFGKPEEEIEQRP